MSQENQNIKPIIDEQIYRFIQTYPITLPEYTDWVLHLSKTSSYNPTLAYLTIQPFVRGDEKNLVVQNLAKNPAMSPEALEVLYEQNSTNSGAVFNILTNETTPEELREKIADVSKKTTRQAALLYNIKDQPKLKQLAQQGTAEIRKLLCYHPYISAESLKPLTTDTRWEIRQLVAAHPTLEETDLLFIANDRDKQVVAGLLNNPNLTVKVANRLGEVLDPKYLPALAQLDVCDETLLLNLAESSVSTHPNIVKHANCTSAVLEILSSTPDSYTAYAVAFHPNSTPETLDRLSYHPDEWVRKAVLSNPNTSPETLTRMLAGPDKNLAVHQAAGAFTPEELLASASFEQYVAAMERKDFIVREPKVLTVQLYKQQTFEPEAWKNLIYKLSEVAYRQIESGHTEESVVKLLLQVVVYNTVGGAQNQVLGQGVAKDLQLTWGNAVGSRPTLTKTPKKQLTNIQIR